MHWRMKIRNIVKAYPASEDAVYDHPQANWQGEGKKARNFSTKNKQRFPKFSLWFLNNLYY